MADINVYLQAIMVARFGKDVRQSIHDGIKAINDEVVDYGSTASAAAESAWEREQSAAASAKNAMNYAESAEDYALQATQKAYESLLSAQDAEQYALNAQESAESSAEKAESAAVSSLAAEQYKEQAQSIIINQQAILEEINRKLINTEFDVDEDGYLIYTDNSSFNFTVDEDGYLEWEVA